MHHPNSHGLWYEQIKKTHSLLEQANRSLPEGLRLVIPDEHP
jgi:hypothetical protein